MSSSDKKKFLLFAGSTYIFIIGSLLVLISLVLVVIFFLYQRDGPDSSVEEVVRKRPSQITFDDPIMTPVIKPTDVLPKETASQITVDGPTVTPVEETTDIHPIETPTQTNVSATPTQVDTFNPPDVSSRISGRVLLEGAPAGGIRLRLEDQNLDTIAETVVGDDGMYNFSNLEATNDGYNLVFSREWNPQFDLGEVISWGWVGPVSVADGASVEIPDFDISLLGFEPTVPIPKASISAGSVSSTNPIQFEWSAYPEATKYWVDLAFGQEQTIVWQSSGIESTSISFDGTLNDNTKIQPGEYRWGVGAQRNLGSYELTIYGYLPALSVVP